VFPETPGRKLILVDLVNTRGRGLNLVKDSSSEILVKDSQIRLQFVSVLPSSLSKVVLLSSLENEMDGL